MPRMITPAEGVDEWLRFADWRYMASRFLWWKSLQVEFMLCASHTFELYFKTCLIHEQSSFPEGHDLALLCRECSGHDQIFCSIQSDPNWEIFVRSDWVEALRYPESLPSKKKKRPTHYIWGTEDLLRLDYVAHHTHLKIDPVSSTDTEIVKLFLNHYVESFGFPRNCPNWDELKRLFLMRNSFFDSTGRARSIPASDAWSPSPPATP